MSPGKKQFTFLCGALFFFCNHRALSQTYIFAQMKTGPDIFFPNAFTPGQFANHIFRPIPVGISSLSWFRVYNRWGQLVFSTSRLGEGWDGNLSGSPQETGTYVWMAQAKTYTGETVSKQGTMVLIR